MKVKIMSPLCLLLINTFFTAQAQFRFDNKLYKTVYMEDLCQQLQAAPDHILLDVRSEGEYEDTSSYSSLNIGRLKNALHINVQELPARWRELLPYKNKTIFIYCSHSQRSRRASRLLADSGFAHIININGGMTNFYLLQRAAPACADNIYETGIQYKLYYPGDIIQMLTENKDHVTLVDIRSDSVFRGMASEERKNANGRVKGAINIPLDQLAGSLERLPKENTIVLMDDFGNESPGAAELLLTKGYKHVGILFDGMDRWLTTGKEALPGKEKWWIQATPYHILSPTDFDRFASGNKNYTVIDVRSADEFNNHHKDNWRNVGHIKDAINIPVEDLSSKLPQLQTVKNKPVIVYAFSGQPDAFEAARLLSDNGFTNVSVLADGIWGLRWRAANFTGDAHLKTWVTDIPPDNQ